MTKEESKKYIRSKMCNDCSVYLGGGKCSDNCKVIEAIKALKQEPVLDKIRAEVEHLRIHKAQFLTNDNKVRIDSREVLDIIDKYKGE